MPAWEFTLKDSEGNDIDVYVAKVVFRETGSNVNALVLLKNDGLEQTGAKHIIKKQMPTDMKPGTYIGEARAVIADGTVYKKNLGPLCVEQSFTND